MVLCPIYHTESSVNTEAQEILVTLPRIKLVPRVTQLITSDYKFSLFNHYADKRNSGRDQG